MKRLHSIQKKMLSWFLMAIFAMQFLPINNTMLYSAAAEGKKKSLTSDTVRSADVVSNSEPAAGSDAKVETKTKTEPAAPKESVYKSWLKYKIVDDGVVITGLAKKKKEIKTPTAIDGKPVVAIAAKAFQKNTTLESIVIPSGVETIGDRAFSGCTNLKSVTLPDTIEKIGSKAFSGCEELVIKAPKKSYAYQYAKDNQLLAPTKTEAPEATATKAPDDQKTATKTEAAPVSKGNITDFTLSATSRNIGVGEKYRIIIKTVEPAAAAGVYTYKSANTKIARVSAGGTVVGAAKGTTKITVTEQGGASCVITIKVCAAPTSVKASPTTLTLCVKGTATIKATRSPGSASAITFTSSNTGVAKVNSSGKVTAVGVGSCDITLKTFNGKTAVCKVTVGAKPTGIAPMKDLVLAQTATVKLSPANLPEGAIGGFTYLSSDTAVATVDSTGLLTAVGKGSAVITVKSSTANVSQTFSVEVKPQPEQFTLTTTSRSIGIKEKYRITIKSFSPSDAMGIYTYTSADTSIARVSSGGTIIGAAKGTTTITVTAQGGYSRTFTVKVCPAPVSVAATPDTLTLCVTETATIKATRSPGSASAITFTSSNTGVAKVNSSGKVTAVGVGSCDITLKTFNGKTAVCKVTVHSNGADIDSIVTDKSSYTEGESITWTVNASLGAPPYQYQYRLQYNGEELLLKTGASSSNTFTHQTPSRTAQAKGYGQYDLQVTVIDAENKETIGHKLINVMPLPLAIEALEFSSTTLNTNSPFTCKAVVNSGREPIRYAFALMNQTQEVIAEASSDDGNSQWCIPSSGQYSLTVTATDADQNVATKTESITVVYVELGSPQVTLDKAYGYKNTSFGFSALANGGEGALHYQYNLVTVTDEGDVEGDVITPPYKFTSAGTYRIKATITDSASGDTPNMITATSDPFAVVEPLVINSLQADLAKPVFGDNVTWTVSAAGGHLPLSYSYTMIVSGVEDQTPVTTTANTHSQLIDYAQYVLRVVVTDAFGTKAELSSEPVGYKMLSGDAPMAYEVTQEGVTILKYLGDATVVTVPKTIEEKAVTRIGNSAFENNTTLQTIYLPDTVKVICEKAFSGCTSLSIMSPTK